MKWLFLLFAGLPLATWAQPYALLHRQLLEPVKVTPHLERGKATAQYFPVHLDDLDGMIRLIHTYVDSDGKIEKPEADTEVKVGHTRMLIRKQPRHATGTSIAFFTRTKDLGFSFELVSNKDGDRRKLQKMKAFLYYLRNNRVLVQEQTAALPAKGF